MVSAIWSQPVTSKKKVQPHGDVVIRVNKKGGDAVNFTVKDIYWAYHTDETVDVAVTPTPGVINQNEFDVAYYDLADLVRPSAAPYRVQCGDPICIVGLFHWHSGSGRNTPIVHSGNIALLPDPKEKIPIRDRIGGQVQKVEAYLVEAQTFEGLSGAPVFQREMVTVRGLFLEQHNGGDPIVATGAQLLGVMREPGRVSHRPHLYLIATGGRTKEYQLAWALSFRESESWKSL
jgi:hypothetical protein